MGPHGVDDGFVRFGVFELDLRQRELRRQGRRVHLQDKPFELLAYLISRPGQLVSRDELQRQLWPADTFVVFDDNLNAAVRKAREALHDSADSPRFIETVPRHGYRFIATIEPLPSPVTPAFRVADQGPVAPIAGAPHRAPAASPPGSRANAIPTVLGAAIALLGLGWAVTRPDDVVSRDPLVRFPLTPPAGHAIPPGGPRLAVSPDGRHVAFVAHLEPAVGRRVWLQSFDAPAPRPVSGTEEAFDVFWGPDGRSLAFVAVGMLRTLDLSTGVATPLGLVDASSGGSWSADAGLLATEGLDSGLLLFSPGGGAPTRVTSLDETREERWHRFPQFLADGRTFLYLAESRRRELSAVYLARLGEPGRRHLVDTPYKAEFVPPDRLLFVKNGRLVSQRLDVTAATLTGSLIDVATDVFTSLTGEAWFSSSPAGVLAYAGPPPPEPRDLDWLADDGHRLGTLALDATCVDIAISPDDRHVALGCRDAPFGPPDVWLAEIGSGGARRLTTHPAGDGGPVWSPDGRTIFYARSRGARMEADIYALDTASPLDTRPILAGDGTSEHPAGVSPDGTLLLFEQEGNVGKEDLWVWPARTGEGARPWLATRHNEHRAAISPDGRWVAYESDRTGRPEVYVRALAAPEDGEWPISARGGRRPKWWRGGRGVFFISEDWQVTLAEPGPSGAWDDVVTRVLFELPGRRQPPGMPPAFDVTSDGRRFLVGPPPMSADDPPMTVMLNWRP